jgi:thioredoxin-dependent peroxiredoxin
MQTVKVTDMLVKALLCVPVFLMTLALGGYASAEMLAEGTRAPDFTLKNQDGSDVTLSQELKKGHIVLYFYPKDNTPGCTKEACSFRDLSEDFRVEGASIFGINTDSVESHKKFHEKQKLTFSLLADPDGTVTKRYGASGLFKFARRVTYLIDSSGTIRKVYPDVDVSTHAAQLLQAVRTLNAEKVKP